MKRRELLLAAGGLLAASFAVAQQTGKVWQVGVLLGGGRQAWGAENVLRDRLRDLGYREGKDISLDVRYDEGRIDRLPALAAEFVRLGKDVIVTGFDLETRAAKDATAKIPIVFMASLNPVESGLVASLARPGGNVTGITYEGGFEVASKRIQIFKEAVPGMKRIGFFFNPGYPGMSGYRAVWHATCNAIGLEVVEFEAHGPKDFAVAMQKMRKAQLGAVFVADGWHASAAERRQIVDFSIAARLPAMFVVPWDMENGALIAYVPSENGRLQRVAALVDRILKGAKPADLPVEQPTHYELIINRKTASASGLTIPQ